MPPSPSISPALRYCRRLDQITRSIASTARCSAIATSRYRTNPLPLPRHPDASDLLKSPHEIPVYPPVPSRREACPEPLKTFTASQLAVLDPSGGRTRLFAKDNPDAAHSGDVMLVRFRGGGGQPVSGVILSIRRRGVDTAILLRNHITRVGVEAWIKVYSPLVTSMEIVERAAKRPRRERLYYMRQPKHDRGSVEGVVANYIKTRSYLGTGEAAKEKARARAR